MKAFLELLPTEPQSNICGIFHDDNAVVAFVDGTPVGVITYRRYDWMKSISTSLSYVEPAYRRRGIYTLLRAALYEKAAELKLFRITSSAAANNIPSNRAQQSVGARHVGNTYEFIVPQPIGQTGCQPCDPLLSMTSIQKMLGISRSTLDRMRRGENKFPAPTHHIAGMPRWSESTIRTWMEAQTQSLQNRRGRQVVV
jgi:predicted DNA-binding transcriptional regulator AlpA/GNAT superfamily N-acetyltransferase